MLKVTKRQRDYEMDSPPRSQENTTNSGVFYSPSSNFTTAAPLSSPNQFNNQVSPIQSSMSINNDYRFTKKARLFEDASTPHQLSQQQIQQQQQQQQMLQSPRQSSFGGVHMSMGDNELQNHLIEQRKIYKLKPKQDKAITEKQFTYDQVKEIVQRVLAEKETILRMEYDKILSERLNEQYLNFVKFNEDYVSRSLKPRDFSYLS